MVEVSKKYARKEKNVSLRNRRIAISVTEEEYKKLSEKATEIGIPVSKLVYSIVMNRTLKLYNPQAAFESRQLAGIGNNLNQIARQLNAEGITGPLAKMLAISLEEWHKLINSRL